MFTPIEDTLVFDDQWYEVAAEIFPCWDRRHARRWYVEISVRPITLNSDEDKSGWTSYHDFDVHAWTLRGLWAKVNDVIMGDLYDHLEEDKANRPDWW